MPAARTELISKGVHYLHNPAHRDNTPDKSQWIITEEAEQNSFRMALNKVWLLPSTGWGLHFEDSKPAYLGLAQDHHTPVFVAKFVNDRKQDNNFWHGYPADHQNNSQDIPAVGILNKWMAEKVLPAPKIRKILKGQPCNL
ncbi:MAG: hypothetical protein HQK60_16965 [Deltaproteobacteria bacterium]|nr:hypothetical protein [Deltaproteobacteria bacterium]